MSFRTVLVTLSLTALLSVKANSRVQQSEQGVKAAFVYNFTRFVTWPTTSFSSPSAPFVIGVVGADSLQGELETIVKNKAEGSHPIVIKHLTWSDIDSCNLLFVPAEESSKASQLSKLKNKAILIVSESGGMLRKGSTINLFLDQDRVLFEISGTAAKDTGLNISSHLLSLSRSPH